MKTSLDLKKPIFLSDDRQKDLHLIVIDIIGASESNLFVSAKYIVNENIRKNSYFNQEFVNNNEILELLINIENEVSGNDFNSYVVSNFQKHLFKNSFYTNKDGEFDETLNEEFFKSPNIKCTIPENWLN